MNQKRFKEETAYKQQLKQIKMLKIQKYVSTIKKSMKDDDYL